MKTKAVYKSETNKHSKVGHEIVFKSIFFLYARTADFLKSEFQLGKLFLFYSHTSYSKFFVWVCFSSLFVDRVSLCHPLCVDQVGLELTAFACLPRYLKQGLKSPHLAYKSF